MPRIQVRYAGLPDCQVMRWSTASLLQKCSQDLCNITGLVMRDVSLAGVVIYVLLKSAMVLCEYVSTWTLRALTCSVGPPEPTGRVLVVMCPMSAVHTVRSAET